MPAAAEQLPAGAQGSAAGQTRLETAPVAAAAEKAPLTGGQAPMPSAGTIPLPLPTPAPAAPAAGQAPGPAPPAALVTDDGDLIEKEWVDKAKRIVEQNRNDPYKQSEELTVFKADYLKKRYGKTIKVSQ
jgi:hypothetical protein